MNLHFVKLMLLIEKQN